VIRGCSTPGCSTLTLGETCLACEQQEAIGPHVLPRSRPYVPVSGSADIHSLPERTPPPPISGRSASEATSSGLAFEELHELIAELVRERQRLRASGASHTLLERNRRQLARSQWELSQALIERHVPRPAETSP
jgi:hypothetical protein